MAGVVLGVTPVGALPYEAAFPPRCQLTESYTGAQIAKQWKQFTPRTVLQDTGEVQRSWSDAGPVSGRRLRQLHQVHVDVHGRVR